MPQEVPSTAQEVHFTVHVPPVLVPATHAEVSKSGLLSTRAPQLEGGGSGLCGGGCGGKKGHVSVRLCVREWGLVS